MAPGRGPTGPARGGGRPGDGGPQGPLFRLEGVTSVRGGRRVLRGVDLSVPAGRVTALLGPSGAGKTSLLRLLNRLDEPTGGTVLFRGRPVPAWEVDRLRRRVGFVFQEPVMLAGSVADDLRVAADLGGVEPAEAEARIRESLALAELDEGLLDRPSDELSVGQKQRVGLARALVSRPEALLLDEPTAALDPPTARRLLATVRRLCRETGLTVVMATHRVGEARSTADRAVMLADGRVVEAGPRERVLEAPREGATRRFLEGR